MDTQDHTHPQTNAHNKRVYIDTFGLLVIAVHSVTYCTYRYTYFCIYIHWYLHNLVDAHICIYICRHKHRLLVPRPTQSIMYVPLQVNRFQKIVLLIVQYNI